MSSLKILRTKETYREKIKTKKQGTQTNIFQSIQNFENFCMEKHGVDKTEWSDEVADEYEYGLDDA